MLDKAVKAGAQVVQKAAKQKVPKGATGNLRKSLKVRNLRSRNPMLSVYAVTFSQKGNNKGYHAHLIEFGHRIFRRKNRGKGSVAATGQKYEMEPTGKKTKARPMLRPAFFSNTAKVTRKMAEKLSVTEMNRLILKKLNARARVRAKVR
jgi:HK97 gp10 family phage protein